MTRAFERRFRFAVRGCRHLDRWWRPVGSWQNAERTRAGHAAPPVPPGRSMADMSSGHRHDPNVNIGRIEMPALDARRWMTCNQPRRALLIPVCGIAEAK
jgi:hypothetical protein